MLEPYYVKYQRHDTTKKILVYSNSDESIVAMIPNDAKIISILPSSVKYDNVMRFLQRNFLSERFTQQKVVSLLEMLEAAFAAGNVNLDVLLQENITHKKIRQMQYELCALYIELNSGTGLAAAMSKVLTIPSQMASLLDIADRTNDMEHVFRSSITHFNYLLSRSYRISKIVYIQIFMTLTEVIASHYMAKTKFEDYFFSIKFRGDSPPWLATAYVNFFAELDVFVLFRYVMIVILFVGACKFAYRIISRFRLYVDYIRLHMPFVKDVDYLESQLNIYRALRLTDKIPMRYDQSLDVVREQIPNLALRALWDKIVDEHERYSMNTHEMIDVLIAKSTTSIRPEPGTMRITDTDIHLLELDLQQRYFRLDMTVLGFGLVLTVAIPLWGVVSYAITQNYYWLQQLGI